MSDSPWYPTHVYRAVTRKDGINKSIIHYEDAEFDMRISNDIALLWIAIDEDSETGTTRDVDGDRAKQMVTMHHPVIKTLDGYHVSISGFVEEPKGSEQFRRETWTQGNRREDKDD